MNLFPPISDIAPKSIRKWRDPKINRFKGSNYSIRKGLAISMLWWSMSWSSQNVHTGGLRPRFSCLEWPPGRPFDRFCSCKSKISSFFILHIERREKSGDRKKHPAQRITEPTSYFRNWCFIPKDGFQMSIKTSVHGSISQVSVQFSSQFAIQNLQFFYALPQVAPPKSRHSKQFPVRLPYPPLPLARPHQPGPGNSGWVEDLNSGLVNITWQTWCNFILYIYIYT